MKPNKKTFAKKIIITFLLILSAFLSINLYIISYSSPKITSQTDSLKNTDAIIILGAFVHPNGNISLHLKDRLDTGFRLYKKGFAKKFLLSGDHGQKEYNEVQAMKDYLLKKGILEENIFMDHAGFDTYDSLYRAKNIFQVNKAIVVTQDYHLKRAVYIGNRLGIELIGYESELIHEPWYYKSRIRETLARVKAFLDVEILKSTPKYLGDPIPITGDGTETQD